MEFQNADDFVTLDWQIAVRTKISDLHIALEEPLPAPRELHDELPVGETEAAHIARSRSAVRDILLGKDDRLLVVVGPCSIHEPESALDYARRIAATALLPSRALKRFVTEALPKGPTELAGIARAQTDAIFASADWEEGRKAFAEKRAAQYRGK